MAERNGTALLAAYCAAGAVVGGRWRVLPGLAAVLLVWALWTWFWIGAAAALRLDQGGATAGVVGILLLLGSFVGLWLGLWAALGLMHGQGLRTLFGPARRIAPRAFGYGLLLGIGTAAVSLLVAVAVLGLPVRAETPGWALWLLPLIALTCVQAGAEEALFRGYLAQQVWRSAPRWGWAVVPALLFGLAHWKPGDAAGAAYVAATGLFGLAAAVLVWREGGLSAALGLHIGTNAWALGLVGVEGVVTGTQRWVYPEAAIPTMFAIDILAAAALLGFVLCRACRVPA